MFVRKHAHGMYNVHIQCTCMVYRRSGNFRVIFISCGKFSRVYFSPSAQVAKIKHAKVFLSRIIRTRESITGAPGGINWNACRAYEL